MARAMTDQAKQEKKAYIINRAFDLYQKTTFNDFRMIDLAEACNMSKGILFKYFKTKEILFFEMLDMEYVKMLNSFEEAFAKHDKITPDILKQTMIDLTRNVFKLDSFLVRLTRIQNVILEQNIDYEFAVEHKLKLVQISNNAMIDIMKKLSNITPQQFSKVFSTHSALLYGYLNNHTQSKVMQKVIEEYQLKQFEVDPIEETIETLSAFIDGYLNR